MKQFIKSSALFTWLIICSGCIQPFEIQVNNNDRVLVISGLLDNTPDENYVNIGYTQGFEDQESDPTIEADVEVIDQDGNVYVYEKVSNGKYKSPPGFQGVVGNAYLLNVEMNEQTYVSKPATLTPPIPIDRIHWKYQNVVDPDAQLLVGGAQFFVDATDNTGTVKYFRYEWEGTREIFVPYAATHQVIEGEIVPIGRKVSPCYQTQVSNEFILSTSVGLAGNKVVDVPIVFINESDAKLRHAYSLLVRQYSLSEEVYNFYKQLRKNNVSSGSFFDAQQGTVVGNISNQDNPDEIVLGYFELSGVSELRKKFRRSIDFRELSLPPFPYYCGPYTVCDPDCVDIFLTTPRGAIELINEGVAAYIYNYEPEAIPPYAYVQRRGCTDCSYYASTEVPDFWNE